MSQLRERLGRLPLERRARFLGLLRAGQVGRPGDRPTPRPRNAPAPLSSAQNLLWFVDQSSPGRTTYNLMLAFRLTGALDHRALAAALRAVVDRHEPLRTRLPETEAGPVQVIAPAMPVDLPVTGVSGDTDAQRRDACRRLAEEFADVPFDLAAGPLWRAALFRVSPAEHLFVFTVHHIIWDGISSEVFVRDLAALYRAAAGGPPADLPDLPIQYADFAHWQRECLTGPRMDEHVTYWREKLRDLPLLDLPTDRPRPPTQSYRGAVASTPVPGATVAAARDLARRFGIGTYSVYLAAFYLTLRRYTGQDDLTVGCSTAVRGRPEFENLLGFFVNMLPLRAGLASTSSFADLVRRVDGVVKEAYAHVDLPFEEIVKAVAPVRDSSRSPLVQVNFLHGESPRPPSFEGLEVAYEQLETHTAKFDMTWAVQEDGDASRVGVEYATDLFDRSTMDSMLGEYARLLGAVLAEPEAPVTAATALSEADRVELIERWAGPVRPSRSVTIDGWFAERAAATPRATAVVAGERRMSYAGLDAAANRLAHLLRRHGAGVEGRVGVLLPRGADYVVAVLATLKAGAAFVPLDPGHPAERLAGLIADADPCVVVTDAYLAPGVPAGRTVLAVDRIGAELAVLPGTAPEIGGDPGRLAYIIFTSGSTGTPKGVLVEHRNVVNFIESVTRMFDLSAADRVLAYASYTFDVSIFEMFSALLNGAELHVALDRDRLDIDRLQWMLVESGITVIDLPPSVMALLTPEPMDRLRVAFVGGEAFPGELVNRWNKGRLFVNGYGPTECTVTMIAQVCAGHWDTSPPIGLPMANHVGYVLDEALRPVPYGVPGELVIGGAGLVRGYLNHPELTAEKFVADPFGYAPGGRLYRTGDLVKRRRGGELVFLGRVDRQIKIRGIRVEPAEVESVLAVHPGVRQAFVTAWTDPRGERHLVAYVSAAAPAPGVDELRAHLADRLPAALVPAYVVVLDELPVTSSGKIDQRALPAPRAATEAAEVSAGPRTETERILLAELFGPMFDADRVTVTANFFELGGSSLQAAQLISGIRRRFGAEISVADFFADPTVAGLAAVVDRDAAVSLDDSDLVELLENMPDELVDQLLASHGTKERP